MKMIQLICVCNRDIFRMFRLSLITNNKLTSNNHAKLAMTSNRSSKAYIQVIMKLIVTIRILEYFLLIRFKKSRIKSQQMSRFWTWVLSVLQWHLDSRYQSWMTFKRLNLLVLLKSWKIISIAGSSNRMLTLATRMHFWLKIRRLKNNWPQQWIDSMKFTSNWFINKSKV